MHPIVKEIPSPIALLDLDKYQYRKQYILRHFPTYSREIELDRPDPIESVDGEKPQNENQNYDHNSSRSIIHLTRGDISSILIVKVGEIIITEMWNNKIL